MYSTKRAIHQSNRLVKTNLPTITSYIWKFIKKNLWTCQILVDTRHRRIHDSAKYGRSRHYQCSICQWYFCALSPVKCEQAHSQSVRITIWWHGWKIGFLGFQCWECWVLRQCTLVVDHPNWWENCAIFSHCWKIRNEIISNDSPRSNKVSVTTARTKYNTNGAYDEVYDLDVYATLPRGK